MPTAADLVAGVALSLAFVLLIAAAEVWRLRWSPPAEWTRKLVHSGGGIVALSIPFVIRSHWVVLGMAVAMGAVFLVSRWLKLLPSLHGVDRRTRGVEYYPLAIYGLYVMSHSQPWKYVICLLVLAVADALAALVGRRFGRLRYEVDGNQKSLEGSSMFFVVTFLVVAIPLLVWPNSAIPSATNCLLAALLTAALATGFEAIALEGRDNLWLPLGVCIVLTKLLRQPRDELIEQNIAFSVIAAGIIAECYLTRALNVGATLVFLLATYGAWSLGSIDWALPAAAGLAIYLLARVAGHSTITIRSRRITHRLLLPFLTLAVANIAWHFGQIWWYEWLYGPYLVGCLAVAIVGMGVGLSTRHLAIPSRRAVDMLIVSIIAILAIVVPCWLLQPAVSPVAAVVAALLGVLVGQAFAVAAPVDERTALRRPMWTHFLAATSMLMMAVAQIVGISPLWRPQ